MSTATTAALELRDLTKTFSTRERDSVRAVDGIDLLVQPGEIVALLGPNGAGKTTTLDMVLGLTEPTGGSVRVHGQAPRRAIADGRVSAVLQTGGLLRDLTVAETVRMIASTYATHRGVQGVLAQADLATVADRRVAKCSGGEQQRLRYALALLPDPDLIVLDEPTAGMDVTSRRSFWSTMRADADAGRTVVFATHYLEEADAFAQRIVMMAGGRVVADGTTHDIRAQASGRVVSATCDDPVTTARRVRAHPAALDVGLEGDRITVHSSDSDSVARLLLTELDARDLEISSGSLESAFLQITAAPEQEDGR
ncbi:ABC transporter ATP-binding protein [Aeromicrobium halocynthiae]|uniref:ABC transporter ATP-binding protein n=1 Tax=Aeromicrobium halocynthiae TaxID=560557 RepID=A0ABN2VYI0_9ACTN